MTLARIYVPGSGTEIRAGTKSRGVHAGTYIGIPAAGKRIRLQGRLLKFFQLVLKAETI